VTVSGSPCPAFHLISHCHMFHQHLILDKYQKTLIRQNNYLS
jgi:hypothetical protein